MPIKNQIPLYRLAGLVPASLFSTSLVKKTATPVFSFRKTGEADFVRSIQFLIKMSINNFLCHSSLRWDNKL
jgi:hypothetical protein